MLLLDHSGKIVYKTKKMSHKLIVIVYLNASASMYRQLVIERDDNQLEPYAVVTRLV
jgi:hypothetical protein